MPVSLVEKKKKVFSVNKKGEEHVELIIQEAEFLLKLS